MEDTNMQNTNGQNSTEIVENTAIQSVSASLTDNKKITEPYRKKFEVVFFVKYNNFARPESEDIKEYFTRYGSVYKINYPDNKNHAYIFMEKLATQANRKRTRITIDQIHQDMDPNREFILTVARSNRKNRDNRQYQNNGDNRQYQNNGDNRQYQNNRDNRQYQNNRDNRQYQNNNVNTRTNNVPRNHNNTMQEQYVPKMGNTSRHTYDRNYDNRDVISSKSNNFNSYRMNNSNLERNNSDVTYNRNRPRYETMNREHNGSKRRTYNSARHTNQFINRNINTDGYYDVNDIRSHRRPYEFSESRY